MSLPVSLSLADILEVAGSFYPNWEKGLAERLLSYFSFDPKQRHQSLSKGKKSTFNAILGIASRCPLTLLDEPTDGMDQAVREDIYRALLKDYLARPRTIILSSHHLSEIENLLEEVLLLKNGQKYMHLPIAEMKEMAVGVQGAERAVKEWTKNSEVIYTKSVGVNGLYTVVHHRLTEEERENARRLGLELAPISLNDLCVYLTAETEGGIDDVFHKG